jgi:hypothetical protein
MLSVVVNVWIGNAAAVLCGRWGAVTRRAREVGYSRTAIYNHAQRVTQAVVHEQEGGVSSEALWAENTRLRAENAALWEAWVTAEQLPESKQQEFAATGLAMGLSLGKILLIIGHYLAQGEHSESGDGRALGRPGEPASWGAVGRAGSVLSAVGVGPVFG